MSLKRKFLNLFIAAVLIAAVAGCAQQKPSASSQEAIQQSKEMKTVDEQVKYLVNQANSFINSQQFDQAIQTAKYILANLDQNSVEAKSILEKATAQLKEAANKTMGDVKNKLGSFGK